MPQQKLELKLAALVPPPLHWSHACAPRPHMHLTTSSSPRFDLQAVKEPGGDPRKERPVEAWAAGKKAAGSGKPAAGRIRFRDGVIVSSNGGCRSTRGHRALACAGARACASKVAGARRHGCVRPRNEACLCPRRLLHPPLQARSLSSKSRQSTTAAPRAKCTQKGSAAKGLCEAAVDERGWQLHACRWGGGTLHQLRARVRAGSRGLQASPVLQPPGCKLQMDVSQGAWYRQGSSAGVELAPRAARAGGRARRARRRRANRPDRPLRRYRGCHIATRPP